MVGREEDSRPLTLERGGNAKSRDLHSGPGYVRPARRPQFLLHGVVHHGNLKKELRAVLKCMPHPQKHGARHHSMGGTLAPVTAKSLPGSKTLRLSFLRLSVTIHRASC